MNLPPHSAATTAWLDYENNAPHELLQTVIPGPRSHEFSRLLSTFEAREVTFISNEFPIFWESATGATVTDIDGNRYLDLGAAFGVAVLGHSHPSIVHAVIEQAKHLLHGMGDVHPTAIRAQLLARLAALTPGTLAHGFLGLNGADAVEFARKTAFLANQRPGALVFEGAYHGLSYGTLELGGIERFRTPFLAQLTATTIQIPYPSEGTISLDAALVNVRDVLLAHPEIGVIFFEPIAGRAGTLVPVEGFLVGLRELATQHQIVLVFDEIYTGFGRTGRWFACQHEEVTPDILCLGKAIAGGVPLSVAIGTPEIMNAWPCSTGEALHTATFLGHPLGCAAALALLEELEIQQLPARAACMGLQVGHQLRALAKRLRAILGHEVEVRGRGMMWALDLGDAELATRSTVCALRKGVLVLQQGTRGTALAITPPLTIAHHQCERALQLLEAAIVEAITQENAAVPYQRSYSA